MPGEGPFSHAPPRDPHTHHALSPHSCAGWGKSVIIGVAGAGQEISTRPFQLVTGRTWMGTAFGGVRGRTALPGMVRDFQSGKLPLERFVTHELKGVEAISEGVRLMDDPSTGTLRPVITF